MWEECGFELYEVITNEVKLTSTLPFCLGLLTLNARLMKRLELLLAGGLT